MGRNSYKPTLSFFYIKLAGFRFAILVVLLLGMFTALPLHAQAVAFQGLITTGAGNGTNGFNSDYIAATSAELNYPSAVAVDAAGNLYIADTYNSRIRKVDATTGMITTVAGIGSPGYDGDNIIAIEAELNQPSGVALDGAGNLYIADFGNDRVREVSAATGLITTVAGVGIGGYNGDNIAATSAELANPSAIALDSAGNLYIADTYNYRIRRVDATTNVITTVAGNGTMGYNGDTIPATSAELSYPRGVALDHSGNLYIADNWNNRIRKVTATTGLISTLAGNGTPGDTGDGGMATSAQLSYPTGVVLDGAGNLYIADSYNHRIRNINATTYMITTVAGNGTEGYNADYIAAPSAELYYPYGVAVDGLGNLYIADTYNNRIRKVQNSAVTFGSENVGQSSTTYSFGFSFALGRQVGSIAVLTQGASGKDFQAVSGGTCAPGAYSSGSSCTVNITFTPLLAGPRNGAIVLYDNSSPAIALTTVFISGTGQGPEVAFGPGTQSTAGSGYIPFGVAVDGSGNLYTDDDQNNLVVKVPWTGSGYGPQSTVASGFSYPAGVAVDGSGNVYVADYYNNRVVKLPWAGSGYGTQSTVGSGLSYPSGVAVDGSGNVYIADSYNNRIVKVPWTTGHYGSQSTVGSGLSYPRGVVVDGSGNVYIADTNNSRVVKVPWTGSSYGAQSTIGSGLSYPTGVAVDLSGSVYIADSGNTRVVKVPWTGSSYGTQSTIGSGLSYPTGVAVDGSGNVYIADNPNNRVVKLDVADAPSLTFPTTGVGLLSATHDVVVENLGNTQLNLTQISTSAYFTIVDPDTSCANSGQLLNPGSSCILGIEFMPTVAGIVSGSVVLTDNTLNQANATQLIGLSGTSTDMPTQLIFGAAPTAIILAGGNAGSAITVGEADPYGTVVSSAANTITLSVTGPNNYSQTYTATASNGVATFNLSSAALTSAGTYTYTATSGSLAAAQALELVAPTAVSLASSTNVGSTTAAQMISMVFVSSGTLNSIQVLTQGAPNLDFTQVAGGTCATGTAYTAGLSCTVNVVFSPRQPGLRLGAVVLEDSGGNVLATVNLSGTGVGPAIAFPPGVITTVAGNGNWGYNSDNIAATTAELAYPYGVAVDGAGNVYIADLYNQRVRKVTAATGAITTVAGNGTGGYNGDNIVATSAELNGPSSVAVDGAGNLYIADWGNQRVRKVTAATGIITTVAGNGTGGYNGDNIAATSAELNVPWGIALDSAGNLYIADYSNDRIRKVNAATGVITTLAGFGPGTYNGDNIPATSAELNGPSGVAVDVAGNFYIADQYNNRVRKVTAATGIITTVAGNGTGGYNGDNIAATSATVDLPTIVALDGVGNLYIADSYNGRIRKVSAATSMISTVAGNGNFGYNGDNIAATSAELYDPTSVALDGTGNLYIADTDNNRIRKADVSDAPSLTFLSTSGGSVSAAQDVVVQNIGNAQLSIGQISTGANFSLGGADTSCASNGQLLNPASGCILGIEFTPHAAGPISGSVVLTDNALNQANATQSIVVNGIGLPPVAQLAFSAAPAAWVVIGGNAGSAITIQEEDASGSLVTTAADTITLKVTGPNSYSQTYTATASGGVATFNLSAAVLSTAGTYTYTGTSGSLTAAAATETVVPAGGSFGSSINVGSSTAAQTVFAFFATSGTLSSIQVLTQGAPNLDFTQAAGGTCATGTAYTAGQNCTVNVVFSPKAPGLRMGAVLLEDSSGNVLAMAYLSGIGVGPAVVFLPGVISTVAGTGTYGYNGDSIAAIAANFADPNGIALDGAGNLYVADNYNQRIRKVTAATGTITTVAGTGSYGYNGDNIAATSAQLYAPDSVAVDGAGNLYVSDSENYRIREISAATGIITTVAGTGSCCYNGDNIAATSAQLYYVQGVAVDGSGNLFIADTNNNRIRKVNVATGIITTVAGNGTGSYNGDNIAATSAELWLPYGIALDGAGNLYIADHGNQRIRRVDATTGIITTVAGTGSYGYNGDNIAATSAKLYNPSSLTADAAGNLYIADMGNQRIRKVNAATGLITTVAGNGSGGYNGDNIVPTSAELYDPASVALDNTGNLYIADELNYRIRKVDVSDAPSLTFPSTNNGSISAAQDVPVQNIGNAQLNISQIGTSANFSLGGADTSCASNGQLLNPASGCILGIEFTPHAVGPISGSVVLTDNALNQANATQAIALSGTGLGPPSQLAFGAPPAVWVVSGGNAGAAITVQEEDASGSVVTTAAGTITLKVTGPSGYSRTYIATASSGVATFNLSAAVLSTAGTYTYTATSGSLTAATATETVVPAGGNFGSSTNVGSSTAAQSVFVFFAASGTVSSIQVLTQGAPNLDFTQAAGGTCATGTAYTSVQSCTVNVVFSPKAPGLRMGAVVLEDSSGNVLAMAYLSGTGVGPAVVFTPGIITTAAGNGTYGYNGDNIAATIAELSSPSGTTLDGAGNLYIVDQNNERIRKVSAVTGIITTLAGTGAYGYNGDNIAATSAELYLPSGVAVDGAGNLYIADQENCRIRKVNSATGIITTVAGSGACGYNGDNIAATTAQLYFPDSVVLDGAGNMYIAEFTGSRIRKVNAATGIITTVAGNGGRGYNGDNILATGANLNYPNAAVVDAAGNILIADTNNNRIRKVNATTGIITTVAGTGTAGYNGDNIAATAAQLHDPEGVAVDAAGNLYIVDYMNQRIRQVNGSTGIITTVAGNGNIGYAGDNGPATSAELDFPYGVAVDSAGNMFIVDSSNNRVRKVDVSDAPSLTFPTTNIGSVSAEQDVVVQNIGNARLSISQISATANFILGGAHNSCASTGQSLNQALSCTLGIEFAPQIGGLISGSAVLTDNALNRANATQSIGLSGTGVQLVYQLAFAVPPAANVLSGGNAGSAVTVWEEDASGTLVTVAADTITLKVTGPNSYSQTYTATASAGVAKFNLSASPLTGSGSYIYTASSGVAAAATATETVVPATVSFGSPTSVGNSTAAQAVSLVFVSSGTLSSIQVLTQGAPNLDFTAAAGGSCATGTAYTAGQNCTVNVVFAPQFPWLRTGAVILMDSGGNVLGVVYVSGTGQSPQVAFGPGTQSTVGSGLSAPNSVAVDGSGNVFIVDIYNNRVLKVPASDPSCSTPSDCITVGSGLSYPYGVAVDGAGNVFIADYLNSRIVKVPWTGSGYGTQSTVGSGFAYPQGVAVDSSGNVYVADTNNNRAVLLPWTGSGYDTQSTVGTGFSVPTGVAVDANGNVYVADYGNARAVKVPWTGSGYGTQSTVGSGFVHPAGVAVDGGGNVYIVDMGQNQAVEVPWTGSGYGTQSTMGSGFANPAGVAVDGSGNVYVADYSNARVVKLDVADPPSLTFPSTSVASVSAAQDVMVQNIGNAQLNISQISTGANFSLGGADTSCAINGQLLNPASSCTLGIEFAPRAASSLSGSVVLTDNSLNASGATQQVKLTGTATAAATITTVSASVNPQNYGSGVTLTAVVTPSTPTPTGTLTFYDGATQLGLPQTLNSSGQAAITTLSLTAGSHTISASYSGDNNYTASSGSIAETITAVTPVITWTAPAAIAYGTALSATQLNATASVPGTIAYTPATGTILGAGNQTLNVTFTPTDSTDYTTATASVTLTVNKSTPTITWTAPAAIGYGTGLSATQLNATASVPGTFAYAPASGTILAAGSQTLNVTFTPTDSTDYASATASVVLTVNKSTPTITWTAPAAIAYGTALSTTQLNATASVPGTFAYAPASGTILGAGSQTLNVIFTPTDSTDYTWATASVMMMVNKATPTITWTAPAAIAYGTALSATQLNASASVPGTFAYAPAADTVLGVGSQTLNVTFTPTDSTDNNKVTASVNLTISKATLMVTANDASMTYGGTVPAFTVSYSGFVNGDTLASSVTGVPSLTTTAISTNAAGGYPITATQGSLAATNYAFSFVSGTLTINKAASLAALQSSAASALLKNNVTFTAHVTSSTSGIPTGSVNFLDGSASLGSATLDSTGMATLTFSTPAAGSHSITVVYGGDANFTGITSAALTETVQDFQIVVSVGSATVPAGGAASYQLQLAPTNGATFPGAITLSLGGLPSGATYTFTPSTVTAGSGATNVKVQVQTAQTIAGLRHTGGRLAGMFFALGLTLQLLGSVRLRRVMQGHALRTSLVILLLVGMLGISACGTGSGSTAPPPPQTYTLTVTATGGALQHSSTLTLTIQ